MVAQRSAGHHDALSGKIAIIPIARSTGTPTDFSMSGCGSAEGPDSVRWLGCLRQASLLPAPELDGSHPPSLFELCLVFYTPIGACPDKTLIFFTFSYRASPRSTQTTPAGHNENPGGSVVI